MNRSFHFLLQISRLETRFIGTNKIAEKVNPLKILHRKPAAETRTVHEHNDEIAPGV
jgi:hypothetical protein